MSLGVAAQATLLALPAPVGVSWSSSDPAVASVDSNGLVTAIAKGDVLISATAGTGVTSASVKVYRASGADRDPTSESLIAQALATGAISAEQALIYRVYAQFGNARLPAAYTGAPGMAPDHLLLREVAPRLPALSQAAQDVLRPFFLPPIYAQSWYAQQLAPLALVSAQGREQPQAAREHPLAVAANCDFAAHPLFIGKVSSEHFNVFYIGKPFFDNNQPLAELLVAVAEEAYAAETALLGRSALSDIDQPCNGGDGKIDIYLTILKDAKLIGQTIGYGDRCGNMPSFILLNQFSGPLLVAYQAPPQARDLLKSALAHEVMHVLQFAMDRAASCADTKWFDEATAEWAMDHVLPKFGPGQIAYPGVEDGIEKVTGRTRSGAFLAEYLYRGHLHPIEQGGPDAYGYSDYLFFQFLARRYSPNAIRNIYDAMAGPGGKSSVEAIGAAIEMRNAWPEFAKSLWNDADNKILDYWATEDGYDFGLYDVFRNPGAQRGAPSNLKPLAIDQKGKGNAEFTLLDNLLPFGSGDYEIAPRSVIYEHLKFTDATVHTAILNNPIAGAPNIEFIKVQVVQKIGGVWQAPEDWTNDAFKSFCLDKKDERIQELILIVSNGEAARATEHPFVISHLAPMKVTTSNAGCWQWTGATRLTTQTPNGPVVVEEGKLRFDSIQSAIASEIGISAGYVTFGVYLNSQAAYTIDGRDLQGCNWHGSGAAAIVARVGSGALPTLDGAMIVTFAVNPILPDLDRTAIGSGKTVVPGVIITLTCSGSTQTLTLDRRVDWLAWPTEGVKLSADGQTLFGRREWTDGEGSHVLEWGLASQREP